MTGNRDLDLGSRNFEDHNFENETLIQMATMLSRGVFNAAERRNSPHY